MYVFTCIYIYNVCVLDIYDTCSYLFSSSQCLVEACRGIAQLDQALETLNPKVAATRLIPTALPFEGLFLGFRV